jgi:hypothetical protein
MTVGADTVCFWESLTGPLLGRATRPTTRGYLTREEAFGDDGYYSLGSDQLIHVDLRGEVVSRADLSGFIAEGEQSSQATLVPELRALVLSITTPNGTRLVRLDALSGNITWEYLWTWQEAAEYGSPGLVERFVLDPVRSTMLVNGGPLFALSDGTIVGRDVRGLGEMVALSAGGRRQLRLGEQVADWDIERQEVRQLYGSHTDTITDLDVSPDGRHFATHGDWAVTWQVASDFSRSRPLFHGAGADVSWFSAIDPSGATMLVSGDNIAVSTRQVSMDYPGLGAFDCLVSGDWAFSATAPWVAGSHYSNDVHVYDTRTFELAATLPAWTCGRGVAFSPDGSKLVTAGLELFETERWTRLWDVPSNPTNTGFEAHAAVAFSPDAQELAVTTSCNSFNAGCDVTRFRTDDGSTIAGVPELDGWLVRYSPEGHWLVSKGQLFHIPTGVTQTYAEGIDVAAFTPEGDLIAGARDGWLARYCRSASTSQR